MKKAIKFAVRQESGPGCGSCRHKVVTKDTARSLTTFDIETGVRVPEEDRGVLKTFNVARCNMDMPHPETHPFKQGEQQVGKGPVLTCREARLNACRGGVLWEALH